MKLPIQVAPVQRDISAARYATNSGIKPSENLCSCSWGEAGFREGVLSIGINVQRVLTQFAGILALIVIVIAATAKDVLEIIHNKNCMIQKSGGLESHF
jgi:hypothetical protein